jgi:hypothetical protein
MFSVAKSRVRSYSRVDRDAKLENPCDMFSAERAGLGLFSEDEGVPVFPNISAAQHKKFVLVVGDTVAGGS